MNLLNNIFRLLICYPSQLSGNNKRKGIIITIPYRLREAKKVSPPPIAKP